MKIILKESAVGSARDSGREHKAWGEAKRNPR
jgi:hypothetical protein